METTVGDAVLAKLSDVPFSKDAVAKFQVFLPKRFMHQLQNEELNSFEAGSLFMVSTIHESGNGSVEFKMNLTENVL